MKHLKDWQMLFDDRGLMAEQAAKYRTIRHAGLYLANLIMEGTPESVGQDSAVRKVREAVEIVRETLKPLKSL